MNKKLLVTAIAAGLMVPGLAAADVKLSGAIQAESGQIDVNTQGPGGDINPTKMGDGSGAIWGGGNNQINISGNEKLGNGLTAYFKIGSTFNTFDSGQPAGSGWQGRDTFVGVKGDGWHVQFGEMNSRYKAASVSYDPFVTTGLQSRATGAVSGLHNGYATDVGEVGFKSGGFSGGFQVSWEDSTNNSDCNAKKTAGVGALGCSDTVSAGSWNGNIKYAANGWEVGAAYMDQDYGGNAGTMDAWKVHGKWSGNGFSVMAQYEDIDADRKQQASGVRAVRSDSGGTAMSNNVNALGLTPAGTEDGYDSWQISATYAISDSTKLIGKYATTDTDVNAAGTGDIDSDHWAIGVTHNLSKRTHVYGGYMDNSYDVSGAAPDADVDAWAVGLMHKF